MKIENIEKAKCLIGQRDRLQEASRLLEAKSARVFIATGDGRGDLSDLFEDELNYAVMDAIAARIDKLDKQLSNL